MARYSGNILRMAAPEDARIAPGAPDPAHSAPAGPEQVPNYYAEQITPSPELGAEYAGLVLYDGVPAAVVAGQPGLGWNPADPSMVPPGSGGTPAGSAPAWTRGDPHNAAVDTSWVHQRGAGPMTSNHDGGDWPVSTYANPVVGTEGSTFLEREVGFPTEVWADPSGGAGVDKFIAGTNSYRASNPEGDQYAPGRGGGRVHYGFESPYFVHTEMYIDKTPQTYERRTAPVTATDPLVGGTYRRTPAMGQLAANPWQSQLGESSGAAEGYGVPVDGVM